MADQIERVYEFKAISEYTFKQQLMIRLGGWLFYVLVKLIGMTLRFDVEGTDIMRSGDDRHESPVLCFWHDRIIASTYYFRDRGIVVMSSISFDAEYTARCIQRFGFGVIKGSSTRGGTRAMVEMIRLMKKGVPMAFTIDGPKGPRYEAKPGPPLLAKRTGNPIVPFCIETSKFWTINSWDRFQVPKPFSRAKLIFGEPIYVDAAADDEALEEKRLAVQSSLDSLVARCREWRESL